ILAIFIIAAMLGHSARTRSEALPLLIPTVLVVGFSVLYYLTWRATHRSHRWAPLAMFIIFAIEIVLNVLYVAMVMASASVQQATFALVAGALGTILPALFALISWRAYATIPNYLIQPAWCQEL